MWCGSRNCWESSVKSWIWKELGLDSLIPVFHQEVLCVCAHSLQLCLTLYNPMVYSPLGSSVHEIFQARILERVAMPHSRESSWTRDQTHDSCVSCFAGGFFTTEPWRKPTGGSLLSANLAKLRTLFFKEGVVFLQKWENINSKLRPILATQ